MRWTLLAVLGLWCANVAAQGSSPPGNTISSAGGRFALGQLSSVRVDQYLVDTQSGRVWRLICLQDKKSASECPMVGFQPTTYLDFTGAQIGWVPPPVPPKPQ